MKKYFQLMIFTAALLSFNACDNKDDLDDDDVIDETTTTPVTTPDDGKTTIIIDENKGVEVESKEGSNVEIDVDKKGGSVKVEDGDNKIDVKIKDDNKNN